MARADRHADADWKDEIFAAVEEAARRLAFFTTDQVFHCFEEKGCRAATHDKRALGPVMLRAAKAGICRKADDHPWIKTARASRHAAPLQVWKSLIYRGP
jgi:hypothetical protein